MTVTKFNFQVLPSDANQLREKAAALGWTTSALVRRLVEEFNAGNFKLSQTAQDKKLIQDIYK